MTKPGNGDADYSKIPCQTWRHEKWIGHQFGRWTVIGIEPFLSPNGSVQVRVRCSCPKQTERVSTLTVLKQGISTSCGCWRNEMSSKRNAADLAGKKFGHLIANFPTEKRREHDHSIIWNCTCDLCGSIREVSATELLTGSANRCRACAAKHAIEKQRAAITIYKTPQELRIITIFRGMRRRCYCKSDRDYLKYGGRGITIYQGWLDNPMTFIKWSLENGYNDGLSIDRIDVNGPYAPWNCRWADAMTQANNRRCNVFIDTIGGRFTASECSRITGKTVSFFTRRPDLGKMFMDDFFRRRDPTLLDPLVSWKYKHSMETEFPEVIEYMEKFAHCK